MLDGRLPWATYRELFTLRNYWKTVQRNKDHCAKLLLWRFLTVDAPHHRPAYRRLAKVCGGGRGSSAFQLTAT